MSLPLARLLVERGKVAPAAMDDALQRQALFGGSLDTNLLEMGLCTEDVLAQALGEVHRLPVANLEDLATRDARVGRLIPPRLAQKYGIVPLALSGRSLTVLTAARLHPLVQDEISFMLSLSLRCQIVCEARLHWLMHEWLGVELEPRFQVLAERWMGPQAPPPPAGPSPEALAARKALGRQPAEAQADEARVRDALGRIEEAERREEREREQARRGRLDLPGALRQALEARSREDLVNVLLRFSRQYFEFVGLFVINNQTILGWDAVGAEGARERIRRIRLPLSVPSVLQTVARTGARFLGPVPPSGINDELLASLGRARPRNALILPLAVRERLVGLLYADAGERAVRGAKLTDLWVFTGRLPEAFELLILRQKSAEGAEPPPPSAPAPMTEPAAAPPPVAPAPSEVSDGEVPSSWIALSEAQPPTFGPPELLPPPEAEANPPPPEEEPVFPRVEAEPSIPEGVLPALPESPAPPPSPPPAPTPAEAPVAPAQPPAPTPAPETALEKEVVPAEEPAPAVEAASLDMPRSTDRIIESPVRIDELPAELERPVNVLDGETEVVVLDSAKALAPALPVLPSPAPPPERAEIPVPPAVPSPAAAVTEPDPDMLVERWLAATGTERREIEGRLRALGEAALPALVRRFPGPLSFDVRGCHDSIPPLAEHGELLRLLLEFGPPAAQAVGQRLEDADPRVRFYAVKVIEELPAGPLVPRLSRRLYDREPFVRLAAIDALQACRKTPQFAQLLADLRARLQEADTDRRAVAAALLGNFRDRLALPGLISLLDHPSRIVARAAMESLAFITKQDLGTSKRKWLKWWKAHKDDNRVLWLIEGLRSKNRDIRFSSAREFSQLTQEYFGYFFDSDPAERDKAVRRIEAWWQEKGRFLRFD